MRSCHESRKNTWFPSHLKELDKAECYSLRLPPGRQGCLLCDDLGPVVLPVNYVFVDLDTVLLRVSPAPHSTLARNLRSAPASFEVDDFDDYNQSGWSVLVRGDAAYVRHRRASRRGQPADPLGRG